MEENIFKESRKIAGLTQAEAAEKLYMSEDKVANFESGKTEPKPGDVVAMSNVYGDVYLCNKFCTNVCEIGKTEMPKVEEYELPQLTVSILNSLNLISAETNRILEIAEDGKVTEDEMEDFKHILGKLDKIESTVASLKLWAKKQG